MSDECKKDFFENSYDAFVTYVQKKFNGSTKRYAIQNYSNINGQYIYNVRIFDDFLATGLTNQRYAFQEEKFVIQYDKNKNLVCHVGNYMNSKKLLYMASNDYLKVEVTEAVEKYSFIIYQIKFTNRTNHIIVIQDGLAEDWEVGLAIGNEIRATTDNSTIIVNPGETKNASVAFEKFYDSSNEPEGIVFNTVRVMDYYTGNAETAQQEIENAVDRFSMTVGF